jgi:hypothetical protein
MSRRRKSANSKASRALAIAQKLQSARELKFVVTSLSQNTDSTGHVFTLNDVPQGLGDTDRVGDRINIEHISLSLWRVLPGSASGRFSIRVLVILDKQDSITSLDSIFLGTGSNQSPFLAFVKDQKLRFSVLYDSHPNHMDQYNKGDCIKWSRKLNIKTQFQNGAADIITGSVKLVLVSNIGSNNNTKPIVIGHVRVDYTDS